MLNQHREPHLENEPAPKSLKFEPKLAAMILRGEKTKTWRFFDDKSIKAGDEIDCYDNSNPNKPFARIRVRSTWEKLVRHLDAQDYAGHEPFGSEDEMRMTYSTYYNRPIFLDTIVKVVDFEVIQVINS